MIKSIYVKNFVLIDELSLDFPSGYSCFTGETGAGKSLLIDAISILCGARLSSGYVQKGKDKAFIEAAFELSINHPVYSLLSSYGWQIDDELLIVSREFTSEGKNTCRINHRVTTVSMVKEVASLLVDIHSQHDTQYLLNNRFHLTLLDEYCNENKLLLEVKESYQTYNTEKQKLDHFIEEEASEAELDYLKYQLDEINQVDIQENEIETLEIRQKEMASFDKISNALSNAIQKIDESNFDCLYEAVKQLEIIDQKEIAEAKERILDYYYGIDEDLSILKKYYSSLEFDEKEYDQIQSRLYSIQKILRKHGNTYKQYCIVKKQMEERIAFIENRSVFIEKQKQIINEAYQKYLKKAEQLSLIRKNKAKKLEKEIMKQLKELHLPNAQFTVSFSNVISEMGIDKVEFIISMNAGETLKPLAKVASGGELSRFMLGMKTVFNQLQNIDTIIFDEIDNGVSGNVAYAIGRKMKQIAENAQVFSVTHLAPVAAWANTHYLVMKETASDQTKTNIKKLNDEERIQELAMISNGSTSASSLMAAKELRAECK